MERVVLVAYKPLPGKAPDLEALIKSHRAVLKEHDLVTDRQSIIVKSEDGTVIEIFGWKSAEAIETAHLNPEVQKMWSQFTQVCEYIPVNEVREMQEIFAEFEPVN